MECPIRVKSSKSGGGILFQLSTAITLEKSVQSQRVSATTFLSQTTDHSLSHMQYR